MKREGTYADVPHPDLILLDLNLPSKNGFEVLAEMKADPDLKTIPVIVFSHCDEESDIAPAYNLQIAAYLVKPTNVDGYFSRNPCCEGTVVPCSAAYPPKRGTSLSYLALVRFMRSLLNAELLG